MARDVAGGTVSPKGWYFGALVCLETATSDEASIITQYQVTPFVSDPDSTRVLIRYTRHSVVGRDSSGTRMHLEPAPADIVDTVLVTRTRFGWRIARIDGGAHLLPRSALDSLGARLDAGDRETLTRLLARGGA